MRDLKFEWIVETELRKVVCIDTGASRNTSRIAGCFRPAQVGRRSCGRGECEPSCRRTNRRPGGKPATEERVGLDQADIVGVGRRASLIE